MIRRRSLSTALLLISAAGSLSLPGMADPPVGASLPAAAPLATPARRALIAGDFGRLPLSFEPNRGQTDSRVRFLSHTGDSTLFLTPSEAIFSTTVQSSPQPQQSLLQRWGRDARPKAKQFALRMQMIGANPKATALEQQALPGQVNYFIGKDPRKWHTGVPTFGRVSFHGVYPGIDLVYYGNQQHLEYDFVVTPHADPQQIKLHFAGAEGVQIDAKGDLLVRAHGREMTWKQPTVYQQDAGGKHSIAAHFRLKRLPNGQAGVRFALGRYDTSRALVIDPILAYSTFLGGSTSERMTAITIDSGGNAYVTGSTESADFPTTSGAFQRTHSTGLDSSNAFITKLNSTGTALVFSTLLGGSTDAVDGATGIAIDSSGNVYVTGTTNSPDFPTTPGAFQRVNLASPETPNCFVTALNPTGDGLIYSTYIGGTSTNGDFANGIAVDSSGNAYVAGSACSSDFPTTPGAFQSVKYAQGYGSANAFVTKFNSTGTALLYSTFIGGGNSEGSVDGGDSGCGIAIDTSGNAYIAGYTPCPDFPTTAGVFQTGNNALGLNNAFVVKLNATGTALLYSTFLGGSSRNGAGDSAYGIAIDPVGNAYIAGIANSLDFPTTPGAFQRVNRAASNSSCAFITKLNAAGTALIYSTYLGGTGSERGNGIAIDQRGNAYTVGSTTSTDFPTTIGAFQRKKKTGSGYTGFVTELNSTGTALRYSTYLGGSDQYGEGATGIALDSHGNIYTTGYTFSADFPITPGAFQTTNPHSSGQATIGFVTKLSPHPIFPDFNNDGNTDLLIQHSTSNVIASWFMQGSQWLGGAYFSLTPPSDYALVGVGDFSGDGSTTLVLQSRTTGQVALWYTNGTYNAVIPGGNFVNATSSADWKVVGVGDFNGDGKSDLVFQNQNTHQVAIWFMNGYLYQGGVLLPFAPPAGWTVAGVADFNADGFPDLVFQNQSTGQINIWYMNGTTYVGGTTLAVVPAAGWKVAGAGDFLGDGSAGLLLQNQTTNQATAWYFQNSAYVGGSAFSFSPPTGWKIVGQH